MMSWEIKNHDIGSKRAPAQKAMSEQQYDFDDVPMRRISLLCYLISRHRSFRFRNNDVTRVFMHDGRGFMFISWEKQKQESFVYLFLCYVRSSRSFHRFVYYYLPATGFLISRVYKQSFGFYPRCDHWLAPGRGFSFTCIHIYPLSVDIFSLSFLPMKRFFPRCNSSMILLSSRVSLKSIKKVALISFSRC